ncbi:MAG TPA: putative motility protein [Chloroflexota bacterium]|nr:putative motility protein [Chloroflexota bacterium]
MDSTALSALTSAGAAAQAQQDASVNVLKKSLNVEGTVALDLIQSIGVPGLGENLDVKA